METPLVHHFCWHDLFTKDPKRAKSYYSELLGWKSQDLPMGPKSYTMLMATNDQADAFGGIESLPAPNVPSHWMSYVAVADLDASLAKVKKLGGSVHMGATDIPGMGKFAIVADPAGASFALYRGNQQYPARGMEQMKPGLPCWMECMTTDLDKALAFYKGLFGWTTTTKPVDDGHIYHMFMNGSYGIGGLMQCPDKNIPSHWYPYFMSADLETSADRAKSLGGTPIMPPTDIGEGMGSFSIQLDPAGAVFGFYSAAAGPAKTC
jgi:hypothetical protein